MEDSFYKYYIKYLLTENIIMTYVISFFPFSYLNNMFFSCVLLTSDYGVCAIQVFV